MINKYENALKNEGRNLSKLARQGSLKAPLHRETLITRALSALARDRSVLLVGEEGVGKTAIIAGIAHALQKAPKENRKKLFELATSTSLSGTKFLGEWESKSQTLFDDAHKANAVIYYSDIWNMPHCGSSSKDPAALLDLVKPRINSGGLLLIGEATTEMLQTMQTVPGFVKLFDIITVEPLALDQSRDILNQHAEDSSGTFDSHAIDRIASLCNQFLPESAGPGPALQLLDQIANYQEQKTIVGEPEKITSEFIEKVFSIYTGLPLFIIDKSSTMKVSDIRQWFRSRIVGQEEAIEAIVEAITLYKSALHDPQRPIGSFMFVGPTGVGKTELAKALATFLFGSDRKMLRFDLSEFADARSYKMLMGDHEGGNNQARLVDPVRQQPFQLILLDELEKGHVNVRDLLLQILDDGRLTPPSGKTVNFRNTIIIATSNAGAQVISSANSQKSAMGFTTPEPGMSDISDNQIRDSLEHYFRPEFLNRFQFIVPFHPLTKEQVGRIVKKETESVLLRDGISGRNLAVDISDKLYEKVVELGYDVRYGARALKREVQRQIVLPVATYLAEHRLTPGSILKLDTHSTGPDGNRRQTTTIKLLNTEQSRQHDNKNKPVKATDGKTYTRNAVCIELSVLLDDTNLLATELNIEGLRESIAELESERENPDFWQIPDYANTSILQLEKLRGIVRRVDQLGESITEVLDSVTDDMGRDRLQYIASNLPAFKKSLSIARRELLHLGSEGEVDALMELKPIGSAGIARNTLYDLYLRWAEWAGMSIEMLCEPLDNRDSIMIGIKGPYAFGLLKLESGLHRLRANSNTEQSVVRIKIAPWLISDFSFEFESRDALKLTGQLGGRVRSRSIIEQPCNLTLQNHRTLEENRSIATDIVGTWSTNALTTDDIIRRYMLEPFEAKDYLTSQSFHRKDFLKPEKLHALLCQRVDIAASNSPDYS